MKVNNNSDSVELSNTSRSKRSEKAGVAKKSEENASAGSSGSLGATANVDISTEARTIAAANQAAKSENVDEAKIARVKAMINGGNYKPDFGKVADKMVNETVLQDLSN